MTCRSGYGEMEEPTTMDAVLLLSPVPPGLYSNTPLKMSAAMVNCRLPTAFAPLGRVKLYDRARAVPLVSGPSAVALYRTVVSSSVTPVFVLTIVTWSYQFAVTVAFPEFVSCH